MFCAVGRVVARHPWVYLLLWIAAATALSIAAPSAETLLEREPPSVLPEDHHHNLGLALAREAFPETAARTLTILVFERRSGLNEADQEYIAKTAHRLGTLGASKWRVLSAATHPHLTSRLLSNDGQAAMIILHHDVNFITRTCAAHVEEIERAAQQDRPGDLTLEITGSGGLGKDLSEVTTEAYHRTTWGTVVAVLTILILVYRAPLAALVPLFSIGASVYVALRILDLLALAGWEVSDLERTFAVVLLFGSGTDFAMFWMARYREVVAGREWSGEPMPDGSPVGRTGTPRMAAVASATVDTGPAIVASAATTIAGLSMLMAADLTPTHNAGRTLGLALFVSLVAALTLTPAVASLMGGALFWPRRAPRPRDAEQSFVWHRVAGAVVRRPGLVLLAAVVLLAWPVHKAQRIGYRYDAFGVIPPNSTTARGRAIAERHFSGEEMFSWTVLVQCPDTASSGGELAGLARKLGEQCRGVVGVSDVWSLDTPLGARRGAIHGRLAELIARGHYVSDSPRCIRAEIMQPAPPFSPEAMALCRRLVGTVQTWAQTQIGDEAIVHAIGLTPYINDVQEVSDADQHRVMALVVAAIAVIVLVWVRRPALTICMVAATLGVYFATLGVADWVFDDGSGAPALDWKVKLFLFVVMMAVGQDYNIFLVSRLLEERRTCDARTAVRRAVVSTGRVISSCGLIMAATLGSIAATGLPFYRQLGFAFAFGILLDTFVIRPAVVPACYLLRESLRAKGLDADR